MGNAENNDEVARLETKAEGNAVPDTKATDAKPEGNGANAAGAKVRSETSYPYFGLTRAIEIVEAVRRAGGNEASNAGVMRELGVTKPVDRAWAYGIPAATQFGLIERVGRGDEGRIKLTELALRIVLPGSADEGRLARAVACKTPDLYARLIEKFAGHPVPTKEGLKNILYREFKIVESMAPNAADAFIESIKAAELVTADNVITASEAPRAPGEEKQKPGKPAPPSVPEVERSGMQTLQVPADFIIYKCKLGKGRVIDIPLPPEFTKAEVDRLYAFLQTQVDE